MFIFATNTLVLFNVCNYRMAKSKFYGGLEPSPPSSPKLSRTTTLHDPNRSQYDAELGGAVLRRRAMASQPSSTRRSIADFITGRSELKHNFILPWILSHCTVTFYVELN